MQLPLVGQGSGNKGADLSRFSSDFNDLVNGVKFGIDNGLTLIDTAEVYGDGRSELIIGTAVKNLRNSVFIATKFSPNNHSYKSVIDSAKGSLSRLGIEQIDLYQIHWPNSSVPMSETVSAMADLQNQGLIKQIGVCNFSSNQLENAVEIAKSLGTKIFSIQIKFNLVDQFAYHKVKEICNKNGIKIIAYSPFKSLLNINSSRAQMLETLGIENGMSPMQVALSWILQHPNVIPIPESANYDHLREISETTKKTLTESALSELEKNFSNLICEIDTTSIKSRNPARSQSKTLSKVAIEKFSDDFCPSIIELANEISTGEFLQPILVTHSATTPDTYEIVEGELRYWAFVYAFGKDRRISAIIN